MPIGRLPYGGDDDQWVELHRGDETHHGLLVLVHGGYWRVEYTATLMEPLVPPLLAAGWDVANVEYRRGPEAVWPIPLDDVRTAIRVARDAVAEPGGAPFVATIGHSVGGQLVLLAADDADATVALAPVTDTVRTASEGLGEDAALDYFRAAPDEAPDRYAAASPLALLPVSGPVLIVHGADDERVPVHHTLTYLAATATLGDRVDAELPHRLRHREIIDPGNPVWASIVGWLDQRAAEGGAPDE